MPSDPQIAERRRAQVLLAVRAALACDAGSILAADLAGADAADLEGAFVDPAVEAWSAIVARQVRAGVPLAQEDARAGLSILARLAGLPGHNPIPNPAMSFLSVGCRSDIFAFGAHPWLDLLLSTGGTGDDDGQSTAPVGATLGAVRAALDALDEVHPPSAASVRGALRAVIGVRGPWGVVRGGSTDDYPGLVLISVNNPPAVLAEELLHESIHVRLQFAFSSNESAWIEALPGLWSVFTETPRSTWRVVHGVAAYRAVEAWWGELERHEAAATLLQLPEEEARQVIRARRDRLVERTSRAEAILESILDEREVQSIRVLLDGLTPSRRRLPSGPRAVGRPLAERIAVILGDVERAEVLCAVAGEKVSRLTWPIRDCGSLADLLHGEAGVCFSGHAVEVTEDAILGGFSNVVERTVPLVDDVDPQLSVHLYVARTGHEARLCAVEDEEDAAGERLGIPPCCASAFPAVWQEALERWNGDLAAVLLDHMPSDHGPLRIPAHANPVAGYFGGGLCWHLPCGFGCDPTRALVERRIALLRDTDTPLLRRLLAIQERPFLWVPGQAYALAPASASDSFAAYRWTAVPELGEALDRAGIRPSTMHAGEGHPRLHEVLGGPGLFVSVIPWAGRV